MVIKEPIHLVGFPKRIDKSAYRAAVDEIAGKFEKLPWICGLFQMGNVSIPGVSDLDLIMVLDDQVTTEQAAQTGLRSATDFMSGWCPTTQYVMVHDLVIVPYSLFHRIKWLIPMGEIKPVMGVIDHKVDLENEEKQAALLFNILDFIIHQWPYDYCLPLWSRKIHVRFTLLRLNQIRHTLEALASLGVPISNKWIDLANEIRNVRESWFELPEEDRIQRLLDVLDESVKVSIAVIDTLGHWLCRSWGGVPSSDKATHTVARLENIHRFFYFVDPYEPQEALKAMHRAYYESGLFLSILPSSFGSYVSSYAASCTGTFGRRFRNAFRERGRFNGDVPKGMIINKAEAISQLVTFLEERKIGMGNMLAMGLYPEGRIALQWKGRWADYVQRQFIWRLRGVANRQRNDYLFAKVWKSKEKDL